MLIADQASQAAETIAALSVVAAQATSSSSSRDPEGKFANGQSVLNWWASWFATAVEPPKKLKGKHRPKWYDSNIIAQMAKMDVHYAGRDWKDVYCYRVR